MKKFFIVVLLIANSAQAQNRSESWDYFLNGLIRGANGEKAEPFDPYAAQRARQQVEIQRLQRENLELLNRRLRNDEFRNPYGERPKQSLNCVTIGNYTTCN